MKIESQKVGSVDVHMPTGPLVDEDADVFKTMLTAKLQAPQPRFVIALQDVPYMDSAALETLLDAADAMNEQNQQLKLVSLSPTCREILELTGLGGRFQVFENVQDAVRSFL
jgi:anti-anti-sigma factor